MHMRVQRSKARTVFHPVTESRLLPAVRQGSQFLSRRSRTCSRRWSYESNNDSTTESRPEIRNHVYAVPVSKGRSATSKGVSGNSKDVSIKSTYLMYSRIRLPIQRVPTASRLRKSCFEYEKFGAPEATAVFFSVSWTSKNGVC